MTLNTFMPVKLITGAGCVRANAKEMVKLGRRCLIVTGKASAKLCGALRDVTDTLALNGQSIRGYCLPDYGSKADAPQEPQKTPAVGGETTVTVNLPQLAKGAQSEAVRALQQLLTAKGYNTRGTDGIFGANTDKALRAYQKAKGLTADGICGKNTWTALLTK